MSYAQDEGWTVVRYGRGGSSRRRAAVRPFFHGQYRPHGAWRGQGAGHPGMDRAPPVSYSRRGPAQFQIPNPPVPPVGFMAGSRPPLNKYCGPHSQSFASVVRQNFPVAAREEFRGNHNHIKPKPNQALSSNGKQTKLPTDPKFGQLVRKFHKLIKMVHHLHNIRPNKDKSEPVTISRMVENLATMIKPASPSPETMELIMGNAKNWGYNTLTILEDHYKAGLETVLADLIRDLTKDWKTAFVVATKWARRNLPRVKQDVIDHAEALVVSSGDLDQEPKTGEQPQAPNNPTDHLRVIPETREIQTKITQDSTKTTQHKNKPRKEILVEAMIHAEPKPMDKTEQTTLKTKSSVATMTEEDLEWSDIDDTDLDSDKIKILLLKDETPRPFPQRKRKPIQVNPKRTPDRRLSPRENLTPEPLSPEVTKEINPKYNLRPKTKPQKLANSGQDCKPPFPTFLNLNTGAELFFSRPKKES